MEYLALEKLAYLKRYEVVQKSSEVQFSVSSDNKFSPFGDRDQLTPSFTLVEKTQGGPRITSSQASKQRQSKTLPTK